MGVESQETRSIPRNRKCGNCRFYEPAPLWRKGWCRNPKLYPPHANHLVDATSIDCEGGFRSRIYWEPLPASAEQPGSPLSQNTPRGFRPVQSNNNPPIYHINSKPVDQPIASSRPVPPPPRVAPQQPRYEQQRYEQPTEPFYRTIEEPEQTTDQMPVVEAVVIEHPDNDEPVQPLRRTRPAPMRPARPLNQGLQPQPGGDWRAQVRQRLPFTQTWPLEKVQFNRQTLPYIAGGIVILLLLFIVIGNLGKKSQEEQAKSTAAIQATSTAQVGATATVGVRLTETAAPTTVAVTPTPTKPAVKTATIKGNGATPLNIRATPSIKGTLVTTVKEGETVTILDGPQDADGHGWYKVDYNGKVGWAVKDYIELQQ